MKKIIIIIILMLFLSGVQVSAQTQSDNDKRIEELKAKISDLQKQENSLSKLIRQYDSEIQLIELQLKGIEANIDKLESEIDTYGKEIENTADIIDKIEKIMNHRIPEAYKRTLTNTPLSLFLADNFAEIVNRYKYLNIIQSQDSKQILYYAKVRQSFIDRKSLRETKKDQQEKLKKERQIKNADLVRNKKDKQQVLADTKNSESEYQKLLAQALAERQAIEKALVEGVKVGPVKKGDPISLVGNSGYPGCSTGKHLHFEIRKDNNWVDPSGYLSSKNIQDEQNGGSRTVGTGSWDWPIQDTVRLTQYFGKTPWSWRYAYSGGIHTGFDMVSTNGDIIRAPADGVLFSSSQACGSSSTIKIKYIEHGSGVVSFYLHVQ